MNIEVLGTTVVVFTAMLCATEGDALGSSLHAYLYRFLGVLAVYHSLRCVRREGFGKAVMKGARLIPGVNALVEWLLRREVDNAVSMLCYGGGAQVKGSGERVAVPFPEKGVAYETLMKRLKGMSAGEKHTEDGKAFAYIYVTENHMPEHSRALADSYREFCESTGFPEQAHDAFINAVLHEYLHSNCLNPLLFPSLRKFENEIVGMTAAMLNGDANVCGTVNSGGTESILVAVKTYRDRARKLRPHIKRPNMVVPITVHPAFEKAAHYFDVETVHVPLREDMRVDPAAVRRAIDANTILVVGSASQYPHGVVDPIDALGDIAIEHGIPLHVDACFGGYMLPWIEKLGRYKGPAWDFRVPGVTSVSADCHKYGYAAKGASVVCYRNEELRSHQFFAYSSWPGGLFGSPSMAGSRPGGQLAAAWASLVSLGEEGFIRLAEMTLQATDTLKAGAEAIPGLCLVGDADMTCCAIGSEDEDKMSILAVADAMEERGWKIERNQLPPCLHFSVMPKHAEVVDDLVRDLRASVEQVTMPGAAGGGTAAMYKQMSLIPDKTIIDDFIVKFFGKLYTPTD